MRRPTRACSIGCAPQQPPTAHAAFAPSAPVPFFSPRRACWTVAGPRRIGPTPLALPPCTRLCGVEPDPIFIQDGGIWTSAGITAGMDLALALVEEDNGRTLALEVARGLVMFLKRPGGQAQFSAGLAAQVADDAREAIRTVRAWAVENPAADLCVEALAGRAGMSSRNFARAFAASGTTPARFVERIRLDAARRILEDTALPVESIAGRTGFASAEVMRRAFVRQLGVAPTDYRVRFRRPQPTSIEEHVT